MNLIIDIGNTHTDMALATHGRIFRIVRFPTEDWCSDEIGDRITRCTLNTRVEFVLCSSVAPSATQMAEELFSGSGLRFILLTHLNCGLKIDYPQPQTIGPDRLANAIGAIDEFGAPVVVVDLGTAVTFDIINKKGAYVGGVIAPGLSAMTDYLHEKTELLPRIKLRRPRRVIGKSTEEAMQIGAIHGYQSMIQGLLRQINNSLKSTLVPAIATGGCAKLVCKHAPESFALRPRLTLNGLRLASNRIN